MAKLKPGWFDRPNKWNVTFDEFYKKLKFDGDGVRAHVWYMHFCHSGLTFEKWAGKKLLKIIEKISKPDYRKEDL